MQRHLRSLKKYITKNLLTKHNLPLPTGTILYPFGVLKKGCKNAHTTVEGLVWTGAPSLGGHMPVWVGWPAGRYVALTQHRAAHLSALS